MKRKALIITNPGEQGAENYCQGVNTDREAYRAFLDSALGGWWFASEVQVLDRPRVADVAIAIEDLKRFDYALVIFSGHGAYSKSRDETVLELRAGHEMDVSDLVVEGKRQTLIIDCCRVFTEETLPESLILKAQRAYAQLDGRSCRLHYEEAIAKCGIGAVKLYACAPGEVAYDTSQGGIYSQNLLRAATAWSDEPGRAAQRATLSVAAAHESAAARVARRRGQPQTPVIEKPRSGPYFPFAVVA